MIPDNENDTWYIWQWYIIMNIYDNDNNIMIIIIKKPKVRGYRKRMLQKGMFWVSEQRLVVRQILFVGIVGWLS